MKTNKQNMTCTLLLIFAAVFFTNNIRAQGTTGVTIGSDIEPTRAALLELKTQQTTGAVPSVVDDANITSATGGLLLPRVKLINVNTMEPFIKNDDVDWVANTNSIKEKLAGLMVYNLTNDGTFYPGVYTWNGSSWMTSQANPAVSSITKQPQTFSFYETGEGTVQPLEFTINGFGTWTYQWYQVTGNNVHVRIGTPIGGTGTIAGTGATTASFTPTGVLKGTTRNANNTGFYRFYCVAESDQGAKLTSETAEVAVGCGAKDNLGEWISFMCFNLGANKLTINDQITHPMTISPANDVDGKHYYIAGEENVYGDLYQWGRIGDGHEKRGQAQGFVNGQKTAGTNQIAYGTGPEYEDGEVLGTSQRYPWRQVKRATTHYGNFIITSAAQNYNWAYNLLANEIDQLWRTGRFAPNDPCAKINEDGKTYTTYYPAASSSTDGGVATTSWRVPSQSEWGSIFKGGGITGSASTAIANTWDWNSTNGGGMEIRPDGKTTTLFLPASGFRYGGNGLLYAQGSNGYYWSGNILSTNAYIQSFNSDTVNPANSNNRSYGFALRCVKN